VTPQIQMQPGGAGLLAPMPRKSGYRRFIGEKLPGSATRLCSSQYNRNTPLTRQNNDLRADPDTPGPPACGRLDTGSPRVAFCVLPAAVTFSVAVLDPAEVGANFTLIVQLEPPGTEPPQVFVCLNWLRFVPSRAMLVMGNAALPPFITVTDCRRANRVFRDAAERQRRWRDRIA